MMIYKLWYRITGMLLKALYRVTYGRHMRWGRGLHMRRGFQATCDRGPSGRVGTITIGDDVFFNNNCALHAMDAIEIGDQTVFGENVRVYDHNHRFADPTVSYREQGYSTAPVRIGRHCWLGSNVTVLKGATIGDNSVIGAGCVIAGEVPANSVVRMDSSTLHVEPIRTKTPSGAARHLPLKGEDEVKERATSRAGEGETESLSLPLKGEDEDEVVASFPLKGEPASLSLPLQGEGRGGGAPASAPMRVLVLDTVMDRGGAETMMMNYLRHMDRTKVTYDFLVNRDYRAAYEDEIEALGGRIHRMCPMYPQYFGKYKRQIRAFLKAHPEYRVIHSNLEERSYFGLREARKLGVPVRIAHAHNRPVGFDAKSIFREYFRMRLPGHVTHMFACGEEAGDWLFGRRNRGRVIQQRNAIDTARYRHDPAARAQVRAGILGETPSGAARHLPLKGEDEVGGRATSRSGEAEVKGAAASRSGEVAPFSLPLKGECRGGGDERVASRGTFVLGHVGRFFPQKNHDFLIDVFAALHRQRPDSELWLVGGGEVNDELKNRIRAKAESLGLKDAVRFLGVRSDVDRIMQGMDAFVLPSLFEGLPVTMIEAQAAGLPCTISDRVPAQCDVTGDVQIIGLDESAEAWAHRILAQADGWDGERRAQGADKVRAAGFDIVENAKWLQGFYQDALAEAERGTGRAAANAGRGTEHAARRADGRAAAERR